MSTEPKRLYRSRTNKVVGGVCGGIAEYFDIDPTLVRIIFVLATIFGGWGLLLYIAALIIVPQNPIWVVDSAGGTSAPTAGSPATSASDTKVIQIIGITMVALGIFFLVVNLDFFSFRQMIRFIWSYLFPIILIGAGVFLLMRWKGAEPEEPATPSMDSTSTPNEPAEQTTTTGRRKRGGAKQNARESTEPPPQQEMPPPRPQLLRSIVNRKFFGVCGGLGEYFNIDPTMVRILFVIITIMSFGFGVLLYLILLFTMPERPRVVTS